MEVQSSLFDAEPYRVEVASSSPGREQAPVSGIKWRRTGLRRDCFACWQQQHKEYDPGKPLYTVRQSAVAELQIWDDDGQLSHHELYCHKHAQKLGWDGSRSYDCRRRRDIEAEAKTALAFKFDGLIRSARPGGCPPSFDDDVSQLVRRAGGRQLDMPEWSVTTSGLLVGRFRSRVKQAVTEWAEAWHTEVDTEPVTRSECLMTAECRVIDVPSITVQVGGYTTAA